MIMILEDDAVLRKFMANQLGGQVSGVVVFGAGGSAKAPFRRGVEPLWECWLESLTLLPLLVPLLSQEHEAANNGDRQENKRPNGFYRVGPPLPP